MKKGRMIGIFILMMALFGFFFVSHAAQTKKTTTKPLTIKTKQSSKPATGIKAKKLFLKPDLVVEKIWLSGGDKGFIAFTLKNNGPGAITNEEHKQGKVKVSYKGFEKTYPFSDVDQNGKLKASGGSVPYKTKEILTSRQVVTVFVDSAEKISEPKGKEGNNKLEKTLGKKSTTLVLKPGKKAGLKDTSKASTKQEKALKPPSKKAKAEPLISIAKVYQKDGKVHIVVKNKGRGRLSARDYKQGEVVLSYGGSTRTWSLKKIDPTGRLGTFDGEVEFDTGLSLKKKQMVRVSVKEVKADKFKLVRLTPLPMLSKAQKTQKEKQLVFPGGKKKKAVIKTPAGMLMKSKKANDKEILAQSQKNATTTISQAHRQVLRSSLPIEFFSPESDKVFQRGETMRVRYRISTPTEAGEVTFRLLSSTHGELATTTHHYEPPDLSGVDWGDVELEPVGPSSGLIIGSSDSSDSDDTPWGIGDQVFSWVLPAEVETPLGTSVHIQGNKGGLMGRSTDFYVQPERFGEIRVSSPNGGEHYERFFRASITWRYYDDPATMPGEWVVELLREGTRVCRLESWCRYYTDHAGYPPYRECTKRVDLTDPPPTGNYRVRVSGGGMTDESDADFRIGISDDWPLISLTSPAGGRNYAKGEIQQVRYYSTSPFDAVVVVLKGDIEVLTLREVSPGSADYTIPDYFMTGDDYKIRVSDRGNPANSVEGDTFTISTTPVDFSIQKIGSDDGRNLYAMVRTNSSYADPFSGFVTFKVERLINYLSWTVSRGISGSDFSSVHGGRVDLGDMMLPADTSGYRCGLEYRVTADEPDIYAESDEENNARIQEVGFVPNRGYIRVYQRGLSGYTVYCNKRESAFWGDAPEFYVLFQSCGTSSAFGNVEIRQVGSWPNRPHAFPTSHDILLHNRDIPIPGGLNQIIRFSGTSDTRCWDSTILIYHRGDFESWAPDNPIRINLRVRRVD